MCGEGSGEIFPVDRNAFISFSPISNSMSGRMKKYAEDFASLWRLEFPTEIPGAGMPEGYKVYGGNVEHMLGRTEGEYGAAMQRKMHETLEGAYVTVPCKEFLGESLRISLFSGMPVGCLLPLNELGIDLPSRYGIFDPSADMRAIEGRLLEFHDMTVAASFFLGAETRDLNARWHSAYESAYEKQ